jgi:PP-loop superfamily ATP-utilizing enzyme
MIKKALREKFACLREIIKKYNSVVLAFSGGKDSLLVILHGGKGTGERETFCCNGCFTHQKN